MTEIAGCIVEFSIGTWNWYVWSTTETTTTQITSSVVNQSESLLIIILSSTNWKASAHKWPNNRAKREEKKKWTIKSSKQTLYPDLSGATLRNPSNIFINTHRIHLKQPIFWVIPFALLNCYLLLLLFLSFSQCVFVFIAVQWVHTICEYIWMHRHTRQ